MIPPPSPIAWAECSSGAVALVPPPAFGPGTGSDIRPPPNLSNRAVERLTSLCSLRPTILELSNEGGPPRVCKAQIGVCQLQCRGTPHIGRSGVEWDCQTTDLRIKRWRSRHGMRHPF